MDNWEELEENLKKLIVKLKHVEERKQVETVIQTLDDLLQFMYIDSAFTLFEDKVIHIPVLVVLESYMDFAGVQQMGWSVLCRLMEVCPSTLDKLAVSSGVAKDWDFLGIHQQILKMLCMHNGNEMIITLGLKTLTLLLKSDAIALLVLDDETDVFQIVVDALKSFTNEEVQKYGCETLRILLEKVSDAQLVEFVESKDHAVILNALNQFQHSEDIVLNALGAVLPLASPLSNVEVLMSGSARCYKLVIDAMNKFPNNEKLQEISCCLFQKFTSENFYNMLVLNGVHDVVVKAVIKYHTNAKLQAAGLHCIAQLTETIFMNNDFYDWKDQDNLYWFLACYQALRLHSGNEDVQVAACWSLNSLLFCRNGLHEIVGDDDKQYPLHRQVMAAMLVHHSSKEVFRAAANVLATLAEQSVRIRKLLLAKGIHINIDKVMQMYASSPDVAESACKVLNRLFQGSAPKNETQTVSGIIAVMKKHESVPAVQIEALRVIACFFNCDKNQDETLMDTKDTRESTDWRVKIVKNQCLLDRGHQSILDAMNRFIGSPAIQKYGLKLLYSLVECSGCLQLLNRYGAVDTVLHTLQMYPDDKDIQYLGLTLLGALITKKSFSLTTLKLLSSVLVPALRRFHKDYRILTMGFRAVLILLESSEMAARVLQEEAFDTVLFKQMSLLLKKPHDKQFLALCCKCLAKMTADDDLKHKMLEKSCVENNTMLAECLLLLGADVNYKSKKNSFLYQVCEKGNDPLLVDLLLNNGAREQDIRDALSVSIKRGDNMIISLLLKKLGLDQTNNTISLSGLHIGKIESSWLSPLFPSNKDSSIKRQTSVAAALVRIVLKYQMKQTLMDLPVNKTDESSSEDTLDKNDDLMFFVDPSSDGVFYTGDDLDSDGSDASGNFGKRRSSSSLTEFRKDSSDIENTYTTRKSHSEHGEREPRRKRFQPVTAGLQRSSSFSRLSDSMLSMNSQKNCIRGLDLSSNDLESLDSLCHDSCIKSHLEHLQKLELHTNNLIDFPEPLCEILKCLTDLDLHSNKFTVFPVNVLEMLRISHLDISRNDIGPALNLEPNVKCPALKKLNVSFNQLLYFPDFLGDVVEKLEKLLVEGNKISEAILPLCLPELMELNLSKNFISVISEEFLKECQKLDIFCASVNLLESLPSLPSRITTLKLLSNNFTSIPEAILKLSHLRSVDMSNNEIHDLPRPSRWESSSLRELVFNCNQISVLDLSEGAYKWCRLEKLHLANNKLKEIPPQIGLLENITSLDVSHNPHLRSFPDEMGKLTKVWDLPLDGLHLDLDLKQLGSKTKDIIRFLQQRLKKSVPYYRMKLMIVGNAGSGKTTLLRQLMKCRHTDPGTENSTIGIDVKDWSVHLRDRQKRELKLNVWDFSGQEEFYSSHPHFMSRRALYLVVYDLSKGPSEVDAIKPWLFNIKARASSSPVILVGTHSDVSDEKNRKACITKITRELLNQRGFPAIRDYHFVNRTDDNDSLGKLRKKIIKECLNFKIRDQPVMGQLIPYSYLELERRILLERSNVPLEFPVTNHQRLLNIVSESQLELDENELPHAVHFLNESGVLLHFEDPALQLQDLYFVDPQWLCKLMAQILTVKEECFRKNPKGIMQRTDVVKFLSQKIKFPQNYMSQYFKLLEKFQIALPLGEEQLLIPSSLPDQRPVIELPHCENSELTIRLYEMPYFPMGFWSRLINRLLEISPYMFSGRERAVRLNRMYWRQGIYLNWSPEAYCLVESTILENKPQSFLKITVPSCRKGFVLLGKIIDHIDSLMEEWFPGLLETEIGSDETLLKKWILYSFEDGQEFEQILLEDLLRIAEEGDLMVHEENPKLTIPIAHIAPDLVLADLPRNIILNADELEMDQTPDFLLGDGGFGSVYRASYRNEEVAVKVFNKHASHRLLRQELAVLSYLHHPSLISLLAAGIRPRLLVMELAPKGSLDHFLQSGKDTLTRTLQHRIALHVADGLSYLHQSMIIYRDLKPHNVLLFTLHPNSEVIAKISDYGIAQYCCGMGIKTSEGTPGFRAPEVARGNVIYNQQADIYSFGLLLYDILTGGLRIMEGLKFPNEFDEMAVQGKLPDPVKEYRCSPWPKVQDLIMDCLKQNPQERPTAAQVYSLLNSAELLCLMQKIVVPSTLTAECIAASTLSFKKPGIWIGNGRRDQAELTFLDVGTGGHTSENVENSRILCLALVLVYGEKQEWIVAGTHSGSLIVIDAVNMASKHHLQKMTDSVTSLFYSFRSKHSRETRYLLVGTADGKLAVFEDKAVKCNDAAPLKIVNIGNRSTPLVCLSESSYSSEKDVFWGGCGTKVVSFSSDFCLHKVIDTKKSQIFPFASTNDSNILSIAVGKYIYLAKKDSHFVEVWDRKAEKPCEFIDCAAYLKDEAKKQNEEVKCELTRAARVKVLFLQESTAIWIGTGGGHILLLDLSTRRPIRVIYRLCDSIRSITAGQIDKGNPKHVVLVLGSATRRYVEDAQSYLFVWDKNLPHEIQYLKKHIEMRQEAFVKMRNYSLD